MFRNYEIRCFFAVFFVITAGVVIIGYRLDPAAGILAAFSACMYGILFFVFTKERYKNIAQLSDEIDQVLHSAEKIYIADSREGELSVLKSEITKMTIRIREQNLALKKEKERLSESLADIAHQLRTPLTSANLILSLLENHPKEETKEELLWETKQLFSQMDTLLTSLLKLSRLDAGIIVFKKEKVEVKSLIEAATRPFMITMELHEITLETVLCEGACVEGDFEWLAEGIRNVVKNCIESVKDGGRICISCQDTVLYTEITLHDNGQGFKEEELSNVFERFYSRKDKKKDGYGIGLALCRTIITRQGGTITAKNHPRGGALFVIRFLK